MTDDASLRQDSLRQDSLKQRLAYHAPVRSCLSESCLNEASCGTTICRPTAEPTGRHSSIMYSDAAPTRQCRTKRAILNAMRFLIGSQCSSSRMAAEIPLNFAMFIVIIELTAAAVP